MLPRMFASQLSDLNLLGLGTWSSSGGVPGPELSVTEFVEDASGTLIRLDRHRRGLRMGATYMRDAACGFGKLRPVGERARPGGGDMLRACLGEGGSCRRVRSGVAGGGGTSPE